MASETKLGEEGDRQAAFTRPRRHTREPSLVIPICLARADGVPRREAHSTCSELAAVSFGLGDFPASVTQVVAA
jgi:hypothetical protein